MFAYKEIITVDDPQNIKLGKPLPLSKGRKIEVLIIAQEQDEELDNVRDQVFQLSISEDVIHEAIK